MLNKQPWTADRGGPPASGLVEGLKTPHRKKETVTNPLTLCCLMVLTNTKNFKIYLITIRNS